MLDDGERAPSGGSAGAGVAAPEVLDDSERAPACGFGWPASAPTVTGSEWQEDRRSRLAVQLPGLCTAGRTGSGRDDGLRR